MTTAPDVISDAPRRVRRGLPPSAGFLRFLLRRLAALVLLGVGITLVAFILTRYTRSAVLEVVGKEK